MTNHSQPSKNDLEMMIRWQAQNGYGSELSETALSILEDALDMLKKFEAPSDLNQHLVRVTGMAKSDPEATDSPSNPPERTSKKNLQVPPPTEMPSKDTELDNLIEHLWLRALDMQSPDFKKEADYVKASSNYKKHCRAELEALLTEERTRIKAAAVAALPEKKQHKEHTSWEAGFDDAIDQARTNIENIQ